MSRRIAALLAVCFSLAILVLTVPWAILAPGATKAEEPTVYRMATLLHYDTRPGGMTCLLRFDRDDRPHREWMTTERFLREHSAPTAFVGVEYGHASAPVPASTGEAPVPLCVLRLPANAQPPPPRER